MFLLFYISRSIRNWYNATFTQRQHTCTLVAITLTWLVWKSFSNFNRCTLHKLMMRDSLLQDTPSTFKAAFIIKGKIYATVQKNFSAPPFVHVRCLAFSSARVNFVIFCCSRLTFFVVEVSTPFQFLRRLIIRNNKGDNSLQDNFPGQLSRTTHSRTTYVASR